MSRGLRVVVSCEHGGRQIPAAYRSLFAGLEELLASHRGWDPGALELARALGSRLTAPVIANTVSRLLVDTNRSPGHRRLFCDPVRALPAVERRALVARYHTPHRRRVAEQVARFVAAGTRALHLGVHSFTPVLDGAERRFDVGWLYDPRRPLERALADRLLASLAALRPDLRQRRNAPYLGRGDGLTTTLRGRHPQDVYLGIELEVNQRWPLGAAGPWRALVGDLAEAVASIVLATPPFDGSPRCRSPIPDGGPEAESY